MNTISQYQQVVADCLAIFTKKTQDYGTSWRILRPLSIADQIFIKAWRIRQLQEGKIAKVNDSIDNEWMAIVNYGIMGLIQLSLPSENNFELTVEEAVKNYNQQSDAVKNLMLDKNHDYGEAWRNLTEVSFVDLILTKLLRIRQIIANDGNTLISEGIDANYADIVNYAIFALIQRGEKQGKL